MIRIRYEDLCCALHAKAHDSARHCRGGGRVTIYLQPGLTACQRKAALRRLRQEASRGCGPALPAPQLTLALGVDRMRTALRGMTAVVRLHPAASLLPATATSVLIALFVLVPLQITHLPLPGVAPGPAPASGAGGLAGASGAVTGPWLVVDLGSGGQPGSTRLMPSGGSSGCGGAGLGSGRRPGRGPRQPCLRQRRPPPDHQRP